MNSDPVYLVRKWDWKLDGTVIFPYEVLMKMSPLQHRVTMTFHTALQTNVMTLPYQTITLHLVIYLYSILEKVYL